MFDVRRLIPVILLLAAAASPAAAHEMWIEASPASPPGEARVVIDLRIGERPPGEAMPRDSARAVRFELLDGEKTTPIRGVDGVVPAGFAHVGGSGARAIAYVSTAARIELAAEEFESYLVEEGLDEVVALRAERGRSAAPGREEYSRSLKALLAVGGNSAGFERPAGLPLELIPETDPFQLSDEPLVLRAVFGGAPLPGLLIKAVCMEQPTRVIRTRTDADGRARLPLSRAGRWLVSGVHMREADAAPGIDWRSVWTSLTFERR